MKKLATRVNFSRIFGTIQKTISQKSAPIKVRIQKLVKFVAHFIQVRPLTSFFIILLILFILIAGGSFLRKPEEVEKIEPPAKEVEIFQIGSAPKITVQAQVEKMGVTTIVAQTAGVVNRINIKEGQSVWQGTTLISLSSNYTGGNAASIQKQLANTTYQHVRDTYDLQKETIGKQRELAEKTDANADELREIADNSLGETRDLISLNDDILGTLDENLEMLEATNVGGVNDDLILQTKQLKSQFLAGNNQAKNALRNAELGADEDKPPANLSNLSRELALKQLELQEKSLELNKETSRLQLQLAQISESLMYPASPFTATVDRIHVRHGQLVSPGTPLVTLAGDDKTLTAIVLVDRTTAGRISKLEPSTLHISDKTIDLTPTYVSSEATNGQLYSVTYSIPEEHAANLTDKSYINIDIPLGYPDCSAAIPFIPIDAVYQSQEEAFVFVVDGDLAKSRVVTLGSVNGRYVEITEGLKDSDQVIINRNVIDSDKITIS